jgi:hypothetical protein
MVRGEGLGCPQVKAPGRQEYGKLSYAGTGICLSRKVRFDATSGVHDLRKRAAGAKPQVR